MKRFITLLVLLGLQFPVYAQYDLDSLKRSLAMARTDSARAVELDLISFTYSRINPDSGLVYGQRALELYEKIGYEKGIASANSDLGINHAALRNHSRAIYYHNRSLEIYRKLGLKKSEAAVNFNISIVYEQQGDYPGALTYAHRALEISEEISDTVTAGFIWESIGTIYFRQKDYERSMDNYEKALKIQRGASNSYRTAQVLGNIGIVHDAQGRYEQALQCYTDALKVNRTYGDKYGEQVNLMNIGLTYSHMKNFDSAMRYEHEALEISRESGRDGDVAVNLGNIGETYYLMAMDSTSAAGSERRSLLQLAVDYLQQAVTLCEKISYVDPQVEFMEFLSKAHEEQGNYRAALTVFTEMSVIKDSLADGQRRDKLKDIEAKRDLMLADKEIELHDKQLMIATLTAQNRKNERILYIAGIVLLVLLISIIVVQYKSRTQAHKSTLQEIANLQSHELRGPVARMLGLVQMLKKESSDENTRIVAGYIHDVSMEVDEIVRKAANMTADAKARVLAQHSSPVNAFFQRVANALKGLVK